MSFLRVPANVGFLYKRKLLQTASVDKLILFARRSHCGVFYGAVVLKLFKLQTGVLREEIMSQKT